MKAIVIGSGIGGIAAAIRLACRGYQVTVFEANDYPGGKLSEFKMSGYRFDAGPSLFTMPQYVDELFELTGQSSKKHFDYQRLNVICKYFWDDGVKLSAYSDTQKFSKELREKLGISNNVLDSILQDSKAKYELTGKIFLEKPLHKFRTWCSSDVIKALTRLHKLSIFKTMHQLNERQTKHPKLTQFFDRFATYNGSNPYKASGILNIIPHFEHHFGAFFPKGGMASITNSLTRLAQAKNVTFTFNTKVKKIICENGSAVGVETSTERHDADIIVSNMDIYPTYKNLLPDEKQPHKILKAERSSSALIFYWGIQKRFPELDLHNILFSNDYKQEFDCLDQGKVYDDPTVYINITSKYNPSDAPEGCENWFTMINVPYNSGQDWDTIIQKARNNIIAKIHRTLGVDISPLIQVEEILDPRSIESKTSSFQGALYGTSSNDKMVAFKRHPNESTRIKGLYFVGGSVHPGGGIPLALLSAKIMSDLLPS